jgi:hypothetical protein
MAAGSRGLMFSIALYFLTVNYVECYYYTPDVHHASLEKLIPSLIIVNASSTSNLKNFGECAAYLSTVSPTTINTSKHYRLYDSLRTKTSADLRTLLLLCMLRCGDVQPNPGPQKRTPKYPCVQCGRGVTSRSKAVDCDNCGQWTHIKCSDSITNDQYDLLVEEESTFSFICAKCSLPPCTSIDRDSPNVGDKLAPPSTPDVDDGFVFPFTSEVDDDFPFPSSSDVNGDDLAFPSGTPDLDSTCPSFFRNNSLEDDQENFTCFNRRGLHFIHLNTRSLLPKITELRIIAQKTKAAVISITESWLDESISDNEISIQGYSVIRKDRNREGGGVCTFINNDIAFINRTDLICEGCDFETMWIELLLPKTKPIVVGTCYHPHPKGDFLLIFEETLAKIRLDSEVVILGDFNICLLKASALSKKYLDLLNLFGLKNLINEPTRITSSTSSAIDHISCNISDKICQSGTIDVGLSDHLLIYCTRKVVKKQFKKHNTVSMRSLKKYSVEEFEKRLNEVDWTQIYDIVNVDEAWTKFKNLLITVIDSIAPVKQVRIKQRSEPWLTSSILLLIKERDKLLSTFKKNRQDPDLYKMYCKVRNQVQRDVKKAKSGYFLNKIEENKNNPKKLWQCLKDLGYSTKVKDCAKIVLNICDQYCFTPNKIANHFNEFFTSVASSLVSKLPPCKNLFSADSEIFKQFYRSKNVQSQFKLVSVDEDFIFKELSKLNISKSTGLDNIPAKFLRDGAETLKAPITYLINLSITSGSVPSELKMAKVTPLYKKKQPC